LGGKDGGGSEEGTLPVVADSAVDGSNGDLGLPKTHIA
jgi:hypothetical protein